MFDGKGKRLKKKREETLSAVRGQRLAFKEMSQRPRNVAEPAPDEAFLTRVRECLTDIEQRTAQETNVDELDSLSGDAERQGHLRAYVCPHNEIRITACLAIDVMEEWNVPKTRIDKLRRCLDQQLQSVDSDPEGARGALRAIFEEKDSWDDYTSDYEDEMRGFSRWWLGLPTIVLLLGAIYSLRFRPEFLPLAVSILLAGAAGSCVSVLTKMPVLEVSLSGELDAYERRILSRVGVGVIASLIGSGLLGWGLISFSIRGQTFTDVLSACSAAPCTGPNTLILLAVSMLFGFSERALTWFERKVFGSMRQE